MKFKVGDQVEIENYGHRIWTYQEVDGDNIIELDEPKAIDLSPERIGQRDIIVKAQETQGIAGYSLNSLGSWYHDNQLKLIYRPEYIEV